MERGVSQVPSPIFERSRASEFQFGQSFLIVHGPIRCIDKFRSVHFAISVPPEFLPNHELKRRLLSFFGSDYWHFDAVVVASEKQEEFEVHNFSISIANICNNETKACAVGRGGIWGDHEEPANNYPWSMTGDIGFVCKINPLGRLLNRAASRAPLQSSEYPKPERNKGKESSEPSYPPVWTRRPVALILGLGNNGVLI
jgi:hypothetical protein